MREAHGECRLNRVQLKMPTGHVTVLLIVLSLSALSVLPANAQSENVYVQVRIINVPQIDAKTNNFLMDSEIHFWWVDSGADPTTDFSADNPYRGWHNRSSRVFGSPQRLTDGRLYQIVRYEGMFASRLLMRDYPFESHSLRAVFNLGEHASASYAFAAEPVVIENEFTMSAFRSDGASVELVTVPPNSASLPSVTQLGITIALQRKTKVFGIKILLPILLVTITGMLALLMENSLVSARMSLLVTALLSLVVLQVSSAPGSSYLTMLDKIFSLARLLIAIGILRVVFTHREETVYGIEVLARRDRRIFGSLVAVLFTGTLAIVGWHLMY